MNVNNNGKIAEYFLRLAQRTPYSITETFPPLVSLKKVTEAPLAMIKSVYAWLDLGNIPQQVKRLGYYPAYPVKYNQYHCLMTLA